MTQPYGESFLSQNLFPDIPRMGDAEGGGCEGVHRQVVAACWWPVPSGQATRERKTGEDRRKKENHTQQDKNHNLFGTAQPAQKHSEETPSASGATTRPKNKRDKQAASCAVKANSKPENKKGRFEKDNSSHITCPSRTLSQEELSKNNKPENKTKQQKPRRKKRAAFRAVDSTETAHQWTS